MLRITPYSALYKQKGRYTSEEQILMQVLIILVHHTEYNAFSVSSVHLLNVLFTHRHFVLNMFLIRLGCVEEAGLYMCQRCGWLNY